MLSLFVALTVFAAAHGDLTSRIIGAEDAREGEFPFVVSILHSNKSEFLSPGSILTKDWVLTSCRITLMTRPDSFIVQSGSIYVGRGGTNRTVDKFVKHDRSYFIGFDLCLFHVSKPFVFNEKVQQATLPKGHWTAKPGDVVTVAGWGTRSSEKENSNVLHKLDTFKLIDRNVCEQELWLRLYPGVECIRSALREEGICQRDTGDPVLKDGVLVGYITAFVRPCRNRVPAIATSVPFFLDWIRESLGPDAAELKYAD